MSQFRNLVLEGGGVKGIAYAGAIARLEELAVMPDIVRVAGTSAGAITAALLAVGASAQQIQSIVGGTNFRKFMDDSFGVVRDTTRLLNEFGWYRGDAFAQWFQKQLQVLTDTPDLTFAQLAQCCAQPGRVGQKYRELFVIGTDLSAQMPIVYSARTTPDTPIWQAVRVSMSIPLFFAAVRTAGTRSVLVDGGATWNYPIDLFDDTAFDPAPEAAMPVTYPTTYGPSQIYNKETLGLRVDTKDEIAAEQHDWATPPQQIDDFFDYIKALAGLLTDMANKAHLHANDWHRTIFIDATGVGATDFDLDDSKVRQLVENGRRGVDAYYTWFTAAPPAPVPINRV